MSRRKRRYNKVIFAVMILIVIITLIGGGVLFFLYMGKARLAGEWRRKIDITDTVVREIEEYISNTVSEDETDVHEYVDVIEVDSILNITADGSYDESIDEVSYYDAAAKANDALKQVVKDILKERMDRAYIETDLSEEELVKEAIGMELEDYLEQYGPDIVPALDEMRSQYEIHTSYSVTRDMITLGTEGDSQTCAYAVTGGMLAVDYKDNAVIYRSDKKQKISNEKDGE